MKTLLAMLLCTTTLLAAPTAQITVQADRPGHKIPSTLWGIFFEDINLSADGGLYAELVRNRSFEDSETPENWKLVNAEGANSIMAIDSSKPLNPMNRRSLKLELNGRTGLVNEGYWGMSIVKGETYRLNFAAQRTGSFKGPIKVMLFAEDKQLATAEVPTLGENWVNYSVDLVPTASNAKASLRLSFSGSGIVFLDMVSLLPAKTWKDHGFRLDLAETLAAMKPSFLRFPGGCWVEGDDMAHMYRWKDTIGDISQRKPLYNIWGYHATHGIGFHEYLQLAEDVGAEPLFDINCGMSHKEVVPMDQMGQWVQDALDALEYANGPTNSVWGALRAKAGHPTPFNLLYMEIGNENGGPAYHERWRLFYRAIKARHPEVQLIANVWSGWPREPMPDLIDEHYYNTPEFFMREAHKYDDYDRSGPKIFVGEYAVTRNCGKGNLRGAIGEAAFMTGIERNSDIVSMACYAPLFVNMNHRKWNPDLINFDSSQVYGLPSYYVQKLFSEHRGDMVLPITVTSPPAEMTANPQGRNRVGVGTWNTQAEYKDFRVLQDGKPVFTTDFTKGTADWKLLGDGEWTTADGALRQNAEKEFVRAVADAGASKDYTIEVRARKLGGREGFLILFGIDNDDDRCWWNLGGWNNTKHGVEMNGIVAQKNGSIETGRWYDIRLEVKDQAVKCYLDGKLIHDIDYAPPTALYASAARDTKADEVILKVVNTSGTALDAQIMLAGLENLSPTVSGIVLTSKQATDENSLDEPTKVAPRQFSVPLKGTKLSYSFPGNSLTVLRIGKINRSSTSGL